jgi:hypothetical protein
MNKESAKNDLEKLIKDYEEHRDQYSQKGYDEHQFCTRILNRFFKILGWDVDNNENNSEYYCDVVLQYKLKSSKPTLNFLQKLKLLQQNLKQIKILLIKYVDMETVQNMQFQYLQILRNLLFMIVQKKQIRVMVQEYVGMNILLTKNIF